MILNINFIYGDTSTTVMDSFENGLPRINRAASGLTSCRRCQEQGSWQKAEDIWVDVWAVRLDTFTMEAAPGTVLVADERLAMAKFADRRLQSHYGRTHLCLRLLLSRYLDTSPEEIRLCRSQEGKPYLTCRSIQFNLSHAGGVALFAFCTDVPVGVDVEPVHSMSGASQIAARWFSQKEVDWIAASPQPEQAFLRCWVCREAIGKASGLGLAHALKTNVLECTQGALRSSEDFLLHEWEPWPGFRAAVACAPAGCIPA